ncbi:MAG: M15 family metallopeptidase [bacterium]|nr:M15 family metallopeptidase [bacterium]
MINCRTFLSMFVVCGTMLYAEQAFYATCEKITPAIKNKMKYSWKKNSPVPLEDLRYITVSHYDFDGSVAQGEIVMHYLVADDIIEIFKELFNVKFPIQSMKLVDNFNASDDDSMDANNCYAHCTRFVDHTRWWSNHSFGIAIDINPIQNPCLTRGDFWPKAAKKYLDRTVSQPGMITKNSFIYNLFIKRGWVWGGECFGLSYIDYHHFQKNDPWLKR